MDTSLVGVTGQPTAYGIEELDFGFLDHIVLRVASSGKFPLETYEPYTLQ